MSDPAPFQPITELLERSLSIRHVYGEPVSRGDTVVIPVAQVSWAFGAGGGQGFGRRRATGRDDSPSEKERRPEGQGGGGGGAVRMNPVGALEIGPQGTRFVRFPRLAPLLGAAALGLAAGLLLAGRWR